MTGTRPSRFGRDAVGDPSLYADMRLSGRQPRGETRVRILHHINRLALNHSGACSAGAVHHV